MTSKLRNSGCRACDERILIEPDTSSPGLAYPSAEGKIILNCCNHPFVSGPRRYCINSQLMNNSYTHHTQKPAIALSSSTLEKNTLFCLSNFCSAFCQWTSRGRLAKRMRVSFGRFQSPLCANQTASHSIDEQYCEQIRDNSELINNRIEHKWHFNNCFEIHENQLKYPLIVSYKRLTVDDSN